MRKFIVFLQIADTMIEEFVEAFSAMEALDYAWLLKKKYKADEFFILN